MLTATHRQDLILQKLRADGHVAVVDLSAALDVSEVTIRKDLRMLEERSLLYRTHGGAHLRNPFAPDRPVSEKATQHVDEKRRIGTAAAAHVQPGDALILGSGTTMVEIARRLAETPKTGLTVVTSAANVVLELTPLPDAEVILLGGVVRPSSASVVGAFAEAMLRDVTCDTLFLGVDGLDVEHGLTTSNAQEALLNRAMLQAAHRTIVVTDASKVGRRGFHRICGLDAIDRLITDTALDEATAAALTEQGVEVERV
ncbi:MAG: DeoR/GlpR family DNA-binding transcription regulator [Bacteroidota bacterium]